MNLLSIIPLQVAIWKLSHIKDPDVAKPSEENVQTKNHSEVLEPLWTMGDILPTNLADILDHQNVDETDDDELDLNDNTGWDSDTYDEEMGGGWTYGVLAPGLKYNFLAQNVKI